MPISTRDRHICMHNGAVDLAIIEKKNLTCPPLKQWKIIFFPKPKREKNKNKKGGKQGILIIYQASPQQILIGTITLPYA